MGAGATAAYLFPWAGGAGFLWPSPNPALDDMGGGGEAAAGGFGDVAWLVVGLGLVGGLGPRREFSAQASLLFEQALGPVMELDIHEHH